MPGQINPAVHETSSAKPLFPEKQEGMFREALTVLNECGVPYAVSGAFALQRHTGIWRFTKDLDVFLIAENVRSALHCLKADGFECEVPDPVWLAKAHRDGFYIDLITGMSNAVITVEHTWIDRSQPAVIAGVKTRVLAPEELLASKVFVTRRERFDGADIAHIILGTRGKMDWARILEVVGEHWELLLWHLVLFAYVYPAFTHFVPDSLWQDLSQRFSKRLASRDAAAPFRGSLVDENMFAIDMRDWGMADILQQRRSDRIQRLSELPKTNTEHRS
jgi:hypothetical protein